LDAPPNRDEAADTDERCYECPSADSVCDQFDERQTQSSERVEGENAQTDQSVRPWRRVPRFG
jgi:hypothetical protein